MYARQIDMNFEDSDGYRHAVGPAEAVVDAVADMLCPPCLERMVIKSGPQFLGIVALGIFDASFGNRRVWQWVMRKLIHAHMGQFAFEVHDGEQKEVAWWRLPALGTREHDAASLLTEETLAWART